MYPEGEGGAAPPADYGYDEGIKSKLTRNLEGLIPLILIIIIAAFLGHKFGLWTIPFLGGAEPIQMLVIGYPSADLVQMLEQDDDLVYYRIREPADLEVAPAEQMAQYDIVLLDQHLGPSAYDHSVSRELGESLENFVRTGGKLIVVMNSGVYRSGGMYGRGVATDVVGWEASFGDVIPVKCDALPNGIPSCGLDSAIHVTGRIHRIKYDHKIMQGIEEAPADPRTTPLSILTYDIKPEGEIVAQIKNEVTQSNYPAIVEKRLIIGKSIYFNYDPAMTPTVWQNTLEYLR